MVGTFIKYVIALKCIDVIFGHAIYITTPSLTNFKDEYEEHLYERKCRSGVCSDLLSYAIDKELCTGCMLCAKKCPTDAIMGAKKTPHYIIPDKCISCGNCKTVCKAEAVLVG